MRQMAAIAQAPGLGDNSHTEAIRGKPAMRTEFPLHRDQPAYYRIYFQGLIDPSWACDFVNMELERLQPDTRGITLLKGTVVDQASLRGILNLMFDLGLPLLGLECIRTHEE